MLRANLSDLASMCAEPFGYTLNLSLPNKLKEKKLNRWIKLFAKGLKEDQLKYKLALIGGDTVVTRGPLILSITLFGYKKKNLLKGQMQNYRMIFMLQVISVIAELVIKFC